MQRVHLEYMGDSVELPLGETVVVFVRGRSVAVLHNGGRRIEPLGAVAAVLDRVLRERGGEPR